MQRYYDGMRSWGAVISAAAATLALVIAIGALYAARSSYQSSIAEAKNKIAADAIFEWYRHQPVNTRPCLEFLTKLERIDYVEIAARHDFQLSKPLKEEVLACLSDQSTEELPELYDEQNNRLTRRGSSFIAHRANRMLSADNFVASLMVCKIGNVDMYVRIGEVICEEDRTIIEKLPNIGSITNSFAAVRQYIASAKPNGCS